MFSFLQTFTGDTRDELDFEPVFTGKQQQIVQDRLDEGAVTISKLLIHPIKSCRGTSVKAVKYTSSGLENDRKWCILDAQTHAIVTAKMLPKMLLITPRVVEDSSDPCGGRLEVSFPQGSGHEAFSVPLYPTPEVLQNWTLIDDATIPGFKNVEGYICQTTQGTNPATFVSRTLTHYFNDKPVHLIYKGPSLRLRASPPSYSFPKMLNGAKLDYHDLYPLLVTSEESFEGVRQMVRMWCRNNGKDGEEWQNTMDAMVIEQYRPNIVFRGLGVPFAEDHWRQISIASTSTGDANLTLPPAQFTLVSKCARCLIPNTDTNSAKRNFSIPSKPVEQYRKGLDPDNPADGCFGCYAVPAGSGVLHVGDMVKVEKWEEV